MKLCADRGTGAPLVLVCALMCDEELFATQLEGLKRQRRVMIFQSEGEASLSDAAAELVSMLGTLGLRRVDLGGLSMGGYIAQEVLARRPHAVRRLILMDTRAEADSEDTRAGRLESIRLLEAGAFEEVTTGLLQRLLAPQHLAELGPRVRTMFRRLGTELFIRQLRMMLSRRDTRETLRAFPGPALCLAGARDVMTPPALHREMAALLPAGQFRVVPGNVGHLSTLEAPGLVLDMLRSFLDTG